MNYIGTNQEFANALDPVAACSTGRFRSHDWYNRQKYALTAALLDRYCDNSSSLKLARFHHRLLLSTIRRGIPLDLSDMSV
jgi:hypothetical protein